MVGIDEPRRVRAATIGSLKYPSIIPINQVGIRAGRAMAAALHGGTPGTSPRGAKCPPSPVRSIGDMNATRWDGPRHPRRLTGVVITIIGLLLLFGAPFVPVWVMISDPGLIPYPERLVAYWLILVGLLLTVWPVRRGA
jgi:hypothetical protein